MLLFRVLIAVALSNDFYVNSYNQIAIGENSVIPTNTIACTPVWHTDPPEPSIHPGYTVSNMGKTVIQASIYWKDSWPLQTDDVFCESGSNCSTNSSANIWYQLPETVRVDPLETTFVGPPENVFYFTRLVVVSNNLENGSNLEAVVNVEYENGEADPVMHRREKRDLESYNYANPSLSDNLKTVFKFAGSKLPPAINGSGIEALIELFWPENDTRVWDEILDHIRYLVNPEIFDTVNTLLIERLTGFQSQLAELAREIQEGQSDVSHHYMNIAQDLSCFENEFIVRYHHNAKKLNFDLLLLYSNLVLIKTAYYSLGLKCNQEMNLTEQNIVDIKRYLDNTIRAPKTGANYHISKVFLDQLDLPANRQYDKIMFARNALKKHGYVSIWNNMIDRPGQKFIDDGIIYSQLIGAENDTVVEYALKQPSEPLTPVLLPDGTYNVLQKLEFYSGPCAVCDGDHCDHYCIDGMKLIYENGATYESGFTREPFISTIDLQNVLYSMTSMKIQKHYLFQFSVHVGLLESFSSWKQSKQTDYHKLGLMCVDNYEKSDLNNFTLEIPRGYKVASMYFSFKPGFLQHMAFSFIPDRSTVDEVVETDWKDWQC